MLVIEISERTVSRLRKLPRQPSQTWKTFLHNHLGQMVSADFFTVPTITLAAMEQMDCLRTDPTPNPALIVQARIEGECFRSRRELVLHQPLPLRGNMWVNGLRIV
jgi:hypothetical protein